MTACLGSVKTAEQVVPERKSTKELDEAEQKWSQADQEIFVLCEGRKEMETSEQQKVAENNCSDSKKNVAYSHLWHGCRGSHRSGRLLRVPKFRIRSREWSWHRERMRRRHERKWRHLSIMSSYTSFVCIKKGEEPLEVINRWWCICQAWIWYCLIWGCIAIWGLCCIRKPESG